MMFDIPIRIYPNARLLCYINIPEAQLLPSFQYLISYICQKGSHGQIALPVEPRNGLIRITSRETTPQIHDAAGVAIIA